MISGLTLVQGDTPKPQAASGVWGQGCFLAGLMEALANGKAAAMTGQPGQAPCLKTVHASPVLTDSAEPHRESRAKPVGIPEQGTSVESGGCLGQTALIEAMDPSVPVETSPEQVEPAFAAVGGQPVLDGCVPAQAVVGTAPSPAGGKMDPVPAASGTMQQTAPVAGPSPGNPPAVGPTPVCGVPDQPAVPPGMGREKVEAVVMHPETTGCEGESVAPQVSAQNAPMGAPVHRVPSVAVAPAVPPGMGREKVEAVVMHPETTGCEGESVAPQGSARNAPIGAPVHRVPSVAVARSPALIALATVAPDEAAVPAVAASQPVPADPSSISTAALPGTKPGQPPEQASPPAGNTGLKEPSDTAINPVFNRVLPVEAAGTRGNAEIADPARLGTEIVDKALMAVEKARWSPDGKATLEIRLDPPHLGQLKVRVVYTSGEVEIRFFTVEQTVRDAVQQALPTLRESLGRQDIQLSGGDVHFGAGGYQEEGGAWGRRGMQAGFAGVTPSPWTTGPAEAGCPVAAGLDLLA